MAFLRNLLATLLGLFIFFFLLIIMLTGIAASSETVPTVPEKTVLDLNLKGIVLEHSVEDPIAALLSDTPMPTSLVDLLYAIEYAQYDDRVKGIYLRSTFLQAGSATLQEIRDALIDFKKSGKFIHAYSEYASEGDFYLLSIADSLYLNPEGSLEFNGLSAGVTFYKGLFDKLDIEPEIFRVGEFKSFVEPFIRKDMSPENKLQLTALINSIHTTYLENIGEYDNIDPAELKAISDNMMVREPADAEKYQLVTKVAYEDELISVLKREMEVEESEDVKMTSYRSYMRSALADKAYSSNKIAVIVADGDIVMGRTSDGVGSDQFAEEIRKARERSSIKAIVLRVNSPGGSLTASEVIWREVMLTKGVKPIIASMSDVAASGGYYISAPCDAIVAQPNTITGSIGIFGLMFNIGDFLENKMGITNDYVATGEFSDIMTVTRSLSPQERSIIQAQVERGYDSFISKVAAGRNMTEEEVLSVAGGRVWTGVQAKNIGLVDSLGSFEDAINMAAKRAGVMGDYSVTYYPKEKPFIEEIFTKLNNVKLFSNNNPMNGYLEKVESLQKMKGIQARLPGDLIIQ
ncbi:MAG: signal peptide peptidase SppA [Cyclobacteriaceae bacterium]